jgi:hypothetical protein
MTRGVVRIDPDERGVAGQVQMILYQDDVTGCEITADRA